MSVLQKLTEGVQHRDMQAEGQALLNKWEATGLLEGLNHGQAKQGMAVLLENQAKELLREASSMAAGDVEGFAAVAFPIVRRVFGGLIANDLISVQPMSLPSGLIFFMDFTHTESRSGQRDHYMVVVSSVRASLMVFRILPKQDSTVSVLDMLTLLDPSKSRSQYRLCKSCKSRDII